MIWSGEVRVVRVSLHSLVLLSVTLVYANPCALCCRSPMPFFIDRLSSIQLHRIMTLPASCGAVSNLEVDLHKFFHGSPMVSTRSSFSQ